MFQLLTTGCPAGYGFVRDYMGNKVYYGTVKECKQCIRILSRKGRRLTIKKGGPD